MPVYAREDIEYDEEMLEKAAPGMRRVGLVKDSAKALLELDEDELKELKRHKVGGIDPSPLLLDGSSGAFSTKAVSFPDRGKLKDTRKFYPSSSESEGEEDSESKTETGSKAA